MSSPEANAPQVRPPHLEHRLVLSQDSHGTVHGTGTMGRFNTWLAVKITKTVGSMWVAYLFAAIAWTLVLTQPAWAQPPVKVLHKTVKVGDLDIFYREAGPSDAPTVLLLHGFPTSSQMFRNLIPALSYTNPLVLSHHLTEGNSFTCMRG